MEEITLCAALTEAFDEQAPLAEWESYQQRYSRALLTLDARGEVSYRLHSQGEGTPIDEWHGRTETWSVEHTLSGDQLRELVARLTPLLTRVHEGHSVEWDGSNHIGKLDEDAQEAHEEIRRICEGTQGELEIWTAAQWMENTSDNEIEREVREKGVEAYAADCEAAADYPVVIIGSCEGEILSRLEERISDAEDEAREENDAREERTVYCVGCGDEVRVDAATYHDGAPHCSGCEASPADDEEVTRG